MVTDPGRVLIKKKKLKDILNKNKVFDILKFKEHLLFASLLEIIVKDIV